MARAGRIHQPRARADLRCAARPAQSRRTCWSSATCACRALTARYEPQGAGARLTIDATPRATSTVTQDDERLTIKFDADALDAPNPAASAAGADRHRAGGPRRRRRRRSSSSSGRASAAFRAIARQPARRRDDAARSSIWSRSRQPSRTAPSPRRRLPAAPPDLPPALAQPASAIRTIAIDPGHGGDDEGVKGAGGAKEKDLDARGRAAR